MSKKLYEETNIQAIANAIREKNNTQNQYTTSQMPNAILQIHGEPDLETLTVIANGNYLPSANKDGFSEVSVNVPNSYTNSDEGKVVKNGSLISQTPRATGITENGTYDTTENNSVTVNVSGGASAPIKLYPDADPDYYSETENQLLVGLLYSSSVRRYYKYSSDPAYVAYYYNGEYSGPILVSETEDGAKYAADGDVFAPAGTITYRGKTYYYSANGYFMRGNGKIDGFATYLGVFSNSKLAAEALLDVALPSAFVITENGTYTVPSGYDGFRDINVSVRGGGTSKGFEVYVADGEGGSRTEQGFFDNSYFVCFFDDNMSNTYTLNGVSDTYSTLATGKTGSDGLKATTRSVINSSETQINGLIPKEGSVFATSHNDSGSYVSVVGGWVGYPAGGTIYESAAVGTSNSVTLNSAHGTLLIFVGASSNTGGITTIYLNGATYSIENIGIHFGAYGMYTAIKIEENTDTNITVTFPADCWSYVSVIGIDA